VVEDLDIDKLRTVAQEAINLYGGAHFWLEGFLSSEPRLVMYTIKLAVKSRHLGEATKPEGSAGHALTLCIIPWH
jgi:hypothetical protein